MTGNVADHPVPTQQRHLTRRSFLAGSTLAVAGGLALYSGEFARPELSITTQPLKIQRLPAAFENFRIVQLSDIHFEEYTEPSFLQRVVDHANSLAADLVLLTGDFISDGPLGLRFIHRAMEHCAQLLRGIQCPQRFAVMGNHDAILGIPDIRSILASVDIPLLVDQHVPIERQGSRIWLCGANDPVTSKPNLDLAIPAKPDGPVILMSHAPDYADTVIASPRGKLVDFMLSGHTHGGQVRFPIVGALHLPEGGQKYVEGLFHLDRMQLYVNRGIGAVGLPFRLNCPPEITLYTLQSV
jgi:predicted MPP superfamily phosphohydrolase